MSRTAARDLTRASDLGIGSLLAIADVNEVKRRFALREAQGKVLEVALVFDAAVPSQGPGKARHIANNSGNDLILGGIVHIFENHAPKHVRSFLAAFDTLADEGFVKLVPNRGKLENAVSVASSHARILQGA